MFSFVGLTASAPMDEDMAASLSGNNYNLMYISALHDSTLCMGPFRFTGSVNGGPSLVVARTAPEN